MTLFLQAFTFNPSTRSWTPDARATRGADWNYRFYRDYWYFGGNDMDQGRSDPYSYLIRFDTDNQHGYVIWAWCGAHVRGAGYASGFPNYGGSRGHSRLETNVRSIDWHFFPR